MNWSTLSILNVTIIQREVSTALALLKTYIDGSSPNLNDLINSIKNRIDELEVFYAANDDGM